MAESYRERAERTFSRRGRFFPSVLAASAALLMTFLPALVFTGIRKENTQKTQERRFTVMLSDIRKEGFSDIEWLMHYADPRTSIEILHPYSGTAVLRRIETRKGPDPDYPLSRNLDPRTDYPESAPSVPAYAERDLSELFSVQLQKKSPAEKINTIEGTQQALCFTDKGIVLPHVFKNGELSALLRKENPSEATILQLVPSSKDLPPELTIVRSCGSGKLDFHAAGALSTYLISVSPGKRKNINLITVDWKRMENRK